MNTIHASGTPSLRSVRHKRLRLTSWTTVIVALIGFPAALYFYSWATISCMGGFGVTGLCEIFISLPWFGLAISVVAYLFVIWIIHELGHESRLDKPDAQPASRYAWQHAKQGYKHLDKGHHRLVRRVHRVSSVAIAGLAAYVSFQYFEADTLANIVVAAITFAICEILNWKTYPKLMQEDELRAQDLPR